MIYECHVLDSSHGCCSYHISCYPYLRAVFLSTWQAMERKQPILGVLPPWRLRTWSWGSTARPGFSCGGASLWTTSWTSAMQTSTIRERAGRCRCIMAPGTSTSSPSHHHWQPSYHKVWDRSKLLGTCPPLPGHGLGWVRERAVGGYIPKILEWSRVWRLILELVETLVNSGFLGMPTVNQEKKIGEWATIQPSCQHQIARLPSLQWVTCCRIHKQAAYPKRTLCVRYTAASSGAYLIIRCDPGVWAA